MAITEPHKFDTEAVAEKTIDLLGGRDKAFALIHAEFEDMRTRWNQDVVAIGRILRSHLYVVDVTRFNRHLLRSKLNWSDSHEESEIPGRIQG